MQIIATCNRVLPDGEIIETVVLPGAQTKIGLLAWDGHTARYGERLEWNGGVLVPETLDPTLFVAMRMPTEPQPYTSARKLISEIAETFEEFTGLSGRDSRLIAFFPLYSWVADCGSVSPRLSLVGSGSRGARQLFQLLGTFCRHAVGLTALSRAGFLSLPFAFGVTPLLSEHRITPTLFQVLDAATVRGRFILSKNRLVEPFSPLAVRTDSIIPDSDQSPSVTVALWSTCNDVPILSLDRESELAKRFQNQLLAFRLENQAKVRASCFDPSELHSPIREVARAWGSVTGDDADLRSELIEMLRNKDEYAGLQLATSREAILTECLLFHCHESQGGAESSVHCGELASSIRVLSHGRGDVIDVNLGRSESCSAA
jgi:hypothetical protein